MSQAELTTDKTLLTAKSTLLITQTKKNKKKKT